MSALPRKSAVLPVDADLVSEPSRLREVLDAVLVRRPRSLLLDVVEQIELGDASLAVVLAAAARVRPRGTSLIFVNASERLRRELTGLGADANVVIVGGYGESQQRLSA